MVLQTSYLVFYFFLYVFHKGIIRRIKTSGKHKILPNQYSVFITGFIECFIFISSSTPDTDHIHVCILSILYQFIIFLFGYSRQEAIRRNPVSSFSIKRLSVYQKIKGFSLSIFFLNKLHCTESMSQAFFIQFFRLLGQCNFKTVQFWFTPPVWLP